MRSVRPAHPADGAGAYRVCLLTGDAGEDATARYTNPDLLGHVFVGPYLTAEPELALVVADDAGIAGYCVATGSTRAFEAWCEREWWPTLRRQYPLRADDSPDARLIRWIHTPWSPPDALVTDHPAHLHVNLLPRMRGTGLGRTLVEQTMRAIAESGAPGLHVAVSKRNANALAFFAHLGFTELGHGANAVGLGIRLR